MSVCPAVVSSFLAVNADFRQVTGSLDIGWNTGSSDNPLVRPGAIGKRQGRRGVTILLIWN